MKVNIAPTRGITDSLECFRFLLNSPREQMGLIWGDPGLGKTTALFKLSSQYNALYFSARPFTSQFCLARRLCTLYGMSVPRSLDAAIETLIAEFETVRKPLLIDEANFLAGRRDLLDLLRVIHDEARIPILFAGMTGIYNDFCKLPLLVDRVQYFCEITPCTLDDTRAIVESTCEVRLADDLIDRVHVASKGKPRSIWRMAGHIEAWGKSQGADTVTLADWGGRSFLPEWSEPPARVVGIGGGRRHG